jgi:hypothetical protein
LLRSFSLSLFLALFCITGSVYAGPLHFLAQVDSNDAVISGYVKDSANGETMIGATIRVRSLGRGAKTNQSGYYALHLPSGQPLLVEISSYGYKTVTQKVTLNPEEERRLNMTLASSVIEGSEVKVETDRYNERQEPQMSRVQIRPAEIKNMPKAGEADLFRIIQLLPGVQTSSEISSGLYIRGGSPDQNLILLDGAVLYNPSHFFGFFSTFNPDAIKDVELIKGGFPVEYGGRLSAVLSVTDKDGDMNQTKGSVSIGLISSRASVETPVGNGALSLSARRTYIDVILKATGLQSSLNLPNYNFFDLNGKFTQTLGANDRIALSGYGGADNLLYSNDKAGSNIGIDWGNQAGSLLWTHILGPDLFTKIVATGSRYFTNLAAGTGAEGFTWKNNIQDLSLYGDLEYLFKDEHKLKFGFQASSYHFQFKVQAGSNPPSANIDLTPLYGALYVQDEWKANDRIAMTGGVRVDGINSKSEIGIDPRLSARYILNDAVTLKASVGVYHQYLKLASNPNLSFFDIWLPVDSTQSPSKALQYILGVSTLPYEGYTFDVETYYKDMSNLVELRPNIISGGKLSDIFFVGTGRAYGIEFFLQKQTGDLTGWLGYTLAWTKRTFPDINHGAEYPPTYDRRNDVDVVLNYKLSNRWTIGSSFTYGTGQAYSQILSEYRDPQPDAQGSLVTVAGTRNALRLPPYNRMDLSATYGFSLFSDKRNAEFDIDLYNVYNHRNTWFRQVDASTNPATINDVKLLPILPTFSLSVTF